MKPTFNPRVYNTITKEFIKPAFQSGYSRLQDHYLDTLQEDFMVMQFKNPGDNFVPEPYVKKKVTYVPPYLKKGKMRNKLEEQRRLDLTLPEFITSYTVPKFHRITLELINLKADEDKFCLLGSFLLIQSISGVIADTIISTGEGLETNVRAGKPVGCKAILTGERMYTFLDKLIEGVFPGLKSWDGLSYNEETRIGKISFTVKKEHIGLFNDIEPIYDNLPSLDSFKVIIETTSGTKENVQLLLSGFQIPVDLSPPPPVIEKPKYSRKRE